MSTMEYQTTIKYVRTSPRKLRLVADAIRKLNVLHALRSLAHVSKHAAGPLLDALLSALSNAKAHGGEIRALRFKTLEISQGPALKRWHAVSRGQAHAFKKRMSHIRVTLTDVEQAKRVKSRTSKTRKNF